MSDGSRKPRKFEIRGIADIPRLHAQRTPQRRALVFEGRTSTFAQWDRRCNQVANALLASLSGEQARIAYLAKNSDRFFDLYFGAAKSRMVMTGVNWRLAPPEIRQILDDAQAEMLFVGREYLPLVPMLRREVPRLKQVVCIDGPGEGVDDFEAWLAPWSDADPGFVPGIDDVALQIYTSGTTGHPKGVQLSNRSLLGALEMVDQEEIGHWDENDIGLVTLPVCHVGGANFAVWTLYAGGTAVVIREANAKIVHEGFRTHPVTKIGLVPAVIQGIVDFPGAEETDFGSLDVVVYGGAPITPELLRRATALMGPVFLQMFGMSETASTGTYLAREDHDFEHRPELLASCGKPYSHAQVKIVDADGKEVAAGESGEILLKGPFVMKGYWNMPEATAKAIVDGWYHTGDAGYRDKDGYVFIRDRVKDMIITGGENVYSAEVEQVLSLHPGVLEVAVIGVPDPKWGEAVKAVVVRRPGSTVNAEEVIAFARERIAAYKCPKSVEFAETLPRNAVGKVLKRTLREPGWASAARAN
ncbi:long-chain-fatty-acid--CoA ligase [Ramlibacter sp.]|uniref:long-chain-fatty-acid--CoA ligase n=1 Tax=Ramlibacter sp. TaxID=1917967 RepID=UPI003D0ECDF8